PSSPNTALFSLYSSRSHRHLHSFPTRRSSDLPNNEADYPWQIDNLAQAPTQLQELVDYARRFSITMRGAALTYNLLLARKSHQEDRKSTRLNSSHVSISYAVFCLKKKTQTQHP